jgi:hypothetical protein
MPSDRTLKKWYSVINKKFFFGELPTNVIVRWATSWRRERCCLYRTGDGYSYEILLNREKNKTNSQKLSSLVHEMIHIATQCRDSHGPLFAEWHLKLTERGIFKKGALLRGICLF